jgi:hypothetical protein
MFFSWSYYTTILIQQFLEELWDFNIFMHFQDSYTL